MDINVNVNYEVFESEDLNIPSSDLKEYLSTLDFYSKDDLEECISEYMTYEFDPENYIKNKNIGQITSELLNKDELVEYFSYLIKEEPEEELEEELEDNSFKICLHCTYESGNYCSNCGKKLK